MALTIQQIRDRLTILSVQITGAQEEAIKLMKELELISAPLPSRGSKKKSPLSQEQVSKFLANRLKKINPHDTF